MTATVSQIPFADYKRLPGSNSSALADLRFSALQYQYRHPDVCDRCGHDCMGKPSYIAEHHEPRCPACQATLADNSWPDTPAKLLGRAAHSVIIEPDTVASEYTVYRGPTSGEGSRAERAQHRRVAASEGKTVLSADDYDRCLAMRRGVYNNKDALRYIASAIQREISITWTHRSGEPMKSRIDMTTLGCIVDLKSSRDISKWAFARQAKQLGYHCQAAIYQDAVEALTGEKLPYKIMAPQNCPPYDVAVWTLPDEALRRGRETYEAGIDMLHRCREQRHWPGMYDGEQELEIRDDYDDDDLICDDAPGDDDG